jgi:hypothetical protein
MVAPAGTCTLVKDVALAGHVRVHERVFRHCLGRAYTFVHKRPAVDPPYEEHLYSPLSL